MIMLVMCVCMYVCECMFNIVKKMLKFPIKKLFKKQTNILIFQIFLGKKIVYFT